MTLRGKRERENAATREESRDQEQRAESAAPSKDESPDEETRANTANGQPAVVVPDGSLQVLLQGAARIRVADHPSQTQPYFRCDIELLPAQAADPSNVQTEALVKNLQSLFQRVVSLSPVLPDEIGVAAANVDEPG